MAGNRPEEDVRFPIAYQSWRHVAFLHWRYEPEVIQAMLPSELAVDIVEGSAWVGLTPFLVEDFRVPGVPALPFLSRYPETNLRTYVRDAAGGDGLWFLSLDVDSLATASAGRLGLSLPYLPARMRVEATETVLYESRRLDSGGAHHRIELRPGPALVDALADRDALLIGRWRAYTRPAGQLVQIPVEHQPWPVHEATLLELEQSITDAAGLPKPDHEPIVHYAPGVDARFGPPRTV